MAISTMLMIAISAAVLSTVQGQQFDGYTFPHDLLGLSDGCFATVNKTISSCPAWLPRYAGLEYVHVRPSSKILLLHPNIVILTTMRPSYRGAAVEILPSEQLPTLCESSCRNDLQSLRASISQACTASSDVMVPNKFAYPGESLIIGQTRCKPEARQIAFLFAIVVAHESCP